MWDYGKHNPGNCFFPHLQVHTIRSENRLKSKSKYTNEWARDNVANRHEDNPHSPGEKNSKYSNIACTKHAPVLALSYHCHFWWQCWRLEAAADQLWTCCIRIHKDLSILENACFPTVPFAWGHCSIVMHTSQEDWVLSFVSRLLLVFLIRHQHNVNQGIKSQMWTQQILKFYCSAFSFVRQCNVI